MFTQLLICGVAIWILNMDVTTGINEDAFLLISSNDRELWILTVDGQEQRKIPNEFPYITKVAYDKSDHVIYYITFDWSSTNSKSNVYKVSLDGDVDFVFSTRDITQDFDLSDMVIDDGYIYLCGFGIYRVKTDGTNLETLTNDFAQGISVNSKDGYLIWTSSFSESIYRSYISHPTLRETLVTDIDNPGYLHVDYDSRKMYWCGLYTGKVQEANINGTDRKTVVEIPNVELQHITGHNGHLYTTALSSNTVFDINIQERSYKQISLRTARLHWTGDIALVLGNITDTGLFREMSDTTQPNKTNTPQALNKTGNPQVLTSLNIGLLSTGIVLIVGIIVAVITTALVLHRRNHADKKPATDSVSGTESMYDEPNTPPYNTNAGTENHYEVIAEVIPRMENVTSSSKIEEEGKHMTVQQVLPNGNRYENAEITDDVTTYLEPVKNIDKQLGPHEGNTSGYVEMTDNTNAYVEPVKNTNLQLGPHEGNINEYEEMTDNTDAYVEPVKNTNIQLGPHEGKISEHEEMTDNTDAYVEPVKNTNIQLVPQEGNRYENDYMAANTDTHLKEPVKNTHIQLGPHEGNKYGYENVADKTDSYVEPVKNTHIQLGPHEGNKYGYENVADKTDLYVEPVKHMNMLSGPCERNCYENSKLTVNTDTHDMKPKDPQCEKIEQVTKIQYANTSIHQPGEVHR